MRIPMILAALVLASTTALAQGTPPTGGAGAPGGMGRGRGAGLTQEQREAARERAREHFNSLTPEQREAMQAWRTSMQTQRQGITEKVRAGTMTREQAREAMRAWMTANKPPVAPTERPTGGGGPRKP